MAPIGLRHAAIVTRLTTLLVREASDNAIVWSQNPFGVPPSHSLPQPDISLLRWRDDYYSAKRPMPEDVLLVVEVADTTLNYDRRVKGPLYAEAGIPEYWIVNLRSDLVEVYEDPVKGAYKRSRKVERGDKLALPAGLEAPIEVNDILGKTGEKSK